MEIGTYRSPRFLSSSLYHYIFSSSCFSFLFFGSFFPRVSTYGDSPTRQTGAQTVWCLLNRSECGILGCTHFRISTHLVKRNFVFPLQRLSASVTIFRSRIRILIRTCGNLRDTFGTRSIYDNGIAIFLEGTPRIRN